jgi:hypothetical protein
VALLTTNFIRWRRNWVSAIENLAISHVKATEGLTFISFFCPFSSLLLLPRSLHFIFSVAYSYIIIVIAMFRVITITISYHWSSSDQCITKHPHFSRFVSVLLIPPPSLRILSIYGSNWTACCWLAQRNIQPQQWRTRSVSCYHHSKPKQNSDKLNGPCWTQTSSCNIFQLLSHIALGRIAQCQLETMAWRAEGYIHVLRCGSRPRLQVPCHWSIKMIFCSAFRCLSSIPSFCMHYRPSGRLPQQGCVNFAHRYLLGYNNV